MERVGLVGGSGRSSPWSGSLTCWGSLMKAPAGNNREHVSEPTAHISSALVTFFVAVTEYMT
jgi:hypothetical protein